MKTVWCHSRKGKSPIKPNVCCAHYQKQWLKFLVFISATVPSGVCSRVMGNSAVAPPESTTLLAFSVCFESHFVGIKEEWSGLGHRSCTVYTPWLGEGWQEGCKHKHFTRYHWDTNKLCTTANTFLILSCMKKKKVFVTFNLICYPVINE